MTERKCGNCGRSVSNLYHRVMSDPNTGEVRACPSCPNTSPNKEYSNFLERGAA